MGDTYTFIYKKYLKIITK